MIDQNEQTPETPETKPTRLERATDTACEALEQYALELNNANLVEECWALRGILDSLTDGKAQPEDCYHYRKHYIAGFRAAQHLGLYARGSNNDRT